jgi:hypothetical protein
VKFAASSGNEDFELLRPVDIDYSMAICDNFQSTMRTDYTANSRVNNAFCLTELATASGVNVRRNNTDVTSYGYVQVFDWKGITLSKGSATPLDPTKTFVKSVENVTLEITGRECYVDVMLTKGQDVSNCVPFTSLRANANTDLYNKFVDVWFDEPGLVCMQRTVLWNDTICNISVVEFYPDQVNVQTGLVYFNGNNSITTTVSGVDEDKSALIFSGTFSSGF